MLESIHFTELNFYFISYIFLNMYYFKFIMIIFISTFYQGSN